MPRPIIRQQSTDRTNQGLAKSRSNRAKPAGGKLKLGRRSEGYLDAVRALDAGSSHADVDMDQVHRDIDEEFRPVIDLYPDGIVAKCYLGHPYEVHTLGLGDAIVEHFERGRPMPPSLERARKVANHPSYICVEVYPTHLVCVRHDGSTSEMS